MRKSQEDHSNDIELWDQSLDNTKINADKFAIFFDDYESNNFENQKQTNQLKRHFDAEPRNNNFEKFQDSVKSFLETSEGSSDPPISSKFKENQIYFEKDQEGTEYERKTNKDQRACFYSKNYREKKKEKIKILEQENNFLRKKVDQLQFRLHQTQMQLNRLEFSPENRGDINQLNQDLMSKLNLVSQADQGNNSNIIEQQSLLKGREKQIEQFKKFYDAYGFGGTEVIQLLEYHVNEFIQNALRDCQKYYFMNWVKNRYQEAQKTSLDYEIQEVTQQNEQEKTKNKLISLKIRPITVELVKASREMYKGYKKTIAYLNKIHDMARLQFLNDFQYALKRVNVAQWFTTNKYSKDARQLRAEWIDLIKSQNEPWEKEKKSGPKKKIVK